MQSLLVILFGLCVGSFLNAAIWRLREGISIVTGRSQCTVCHTPLAWRDLMPILSYLILGGVCRTCDKPISFQYPLVEIGVALLFLVFFWMDASQPLLLIRDWVFVALGTILFVYDLRWYELPDSITLPAIGIFYVINGILFHPSSSPVAGALDGVAGLLFTNGWIYFALSAAVGASFFLFQYIVSKGRWIGGGDIRLGALMGALLGLTDLGVALFIAYMVGAACGVFLIALKKKGLSSEIPFGPFLLLGTLSALLFHAPIHVFISQVF